MPHNYQAVLEQTLANFECTTGTVHLVDEKTGLLTLVAHAGLPPHIVPIVKSIPIGKGIAGCAAERRKPVQLCNLQTDDSGVAKPGAKETRVQGSLAVPIIDEHGVLRGVIGIGKREPYEFLKEEQKILAKIAAKLAT